MGKVQVILLKKVQWDEAVKLGVGAEAKAKAEVEAKEWVRSIQQERYR